MKRLYLFGPVYGSGEDDCVSASKVSQFLETLGQDETFEVYVNSPGGSVFEGLAIYNMLSEYSSRFVAKVIGEASSIASVIVCAASRVMIADTAMMYIHNPWTFSVVDEDYLERLTKTLKTIKEQILKVYAKKTGLKADELSGIMNAGGLLSAEDAVVYGFADEIYVPSEEEVKVVERSEQVKNELLRKYTIFNMVDYVELKKELEMGKEKDKPEVDTREIEMLRGEIDSLKIELARRQDELANLTVELKKRDEERQQLEQELQNERLKLWQVEEIAFCERLITEKKLTRAEYIGNSKEGELPAKVQKLLRLRALDEELYKAEREEMQSRQSLEALSSGFDGLTKAEVPANGLVQFIKENYRGGKK